jgi:uncharacterized protein VirK/YbjX
MIEIIKNLIVSLAKFYQLKIGCDIRKITTKRIVQCFKFILNIRQFITFYKTISSDHNISALMENPTFLYKFIGDYLACSFSTQERLKILQNHYEFIHEHFKSHLLFSSLKTGIIIWSKTSEHSNHSIRLTSSSNMQFEEGELLVQYHYNSQCIFSLAFTIVPGETLGLQAKHVIFIGGSQGKGKSTVQMRSAAISNNEIYPPAMLIVALQAFSKVLNISIIAGVTSKNQITNCVNSNTQRYYSTYDLLWIASGGKNVNNMFYYFSNSLHEKDINLIKRNHRLRTKQKRKYKHDIMEEIYSNLLYCIQNVSSL